MEETPPSTICRSPAVEPESKACGDPFLVFVLVAVLFLPSLRGGFVYDSPAQILYSDALHQPGFLWDALTLRVFRMDVIDRLRPAQLVSLGLDARLWGRNPFGYHWTSILLHALNAALAFRLLWQALADVAFRRPAAWLGALLFAVHPALVEAVAEVSFREDLLATTGVLGGLLALARAARHTGWRRAAGAGAAIALLLLAAGAKETGWMGPFLLAVSGAALARRSDTRLYAGTASAAALLIAGFALYARAVAPDASAIFRHAPTYPAGGLKGMFPLWPRFWAFQVFQAVFPYALCADYGGYSLRLFSTAGSVTALALLAAGAMGLAVRYPRTRFGLVFLALASLPTSNLWPIFIPLADRYLYLPLVGAALAAAGLLTELAAPTRRRLGIVLATLCALWIPVNLHRQWIWRDPVRLWEHTLRGNPHSRVASNNLGHALLERGRYTDALKAWRRAVQLHPGHANAWAGIALAQEALGNRDQADAALAQAIESDPIYADADAVRAALLLSPGQTEALRPLLARRRVEPSDSMPPEVKSTAAPSRGADAPEPRPPLRFDPD